MTLGIKTLSRNDRFVLFWGRITLLGLWFLYIDVSLVGAVEKTVEVNSTVLPHRWSAIKLSNVNQGATLEVKLILDGQTTVMLVNESQMKDYPRVFRPLFRTETRTRALFSIVASQSGNYYLVLDNRKNATPRKYSGLITARLDLSEHNHSGPRRLAGQNAFQKLSEAIQTAFVVEPIHFKYTICESANTLTRDDTIYLCQEYFKRLQDRIRNREDINEIILFELMKEAGYVLLRRWKYPLLNSGHVKDEFATALLLMFERRKTVEVQAQYSGILEPEKPDRSRRLTGWLSDPYLVKKWQPFLVPKMQTDYLRVLKKKSYPWTSRKLIDRELVQRR